MAGTPVASMNPVAWLNPALTVGVAEGGSRTETAPLDAVAVRFEDFYAVHRDELARALGLALRDGELGAEAADEAFARACQRWGQVSAYANPQGWVFRVGLNWARSWLRRVRRERERQPLLAQAHATEDGARDVDLERALATLNDAHRAVIVARFYLDWSVAETAEALGVAEGTVKSRLSRGLEQLRDVLDPEPAAPVGAVPGGVGADTAGSGGAPRDGTGAGAAGAHGARPGGVR